MTLEEFLKLPEGWTAWEFVSTYELEGPPPQRRMCGFPKGYDPMTREEMITAAAQAIATP